MALVQQFGSAWRPGGYTNKTIWGNQCWFVDYDNGNDSFSGTEPNAPKKYLDTALGKAAAWDVIYVRGRTTADTSGGDPYYVLPSSTSNFTTTATQYGLSVIGTIVGQGMGGSHLSTQIRGSATANATPAIYLKAPGMNVENICWRRGGSTVAAIQLAGTAFNSTIANCTLQKVTTYPAILNTDAWYTGIYNCTFQSCFQGIQFHAATASVQNIVVSDCDFQGLASEVSADIYVNATGTGLINALIKNCYFNHAIPSGGQNKYILIDATSTGMVANCWTGAAADTLATNMTLNGLTGVDIRNVQVGLMA